MYLTRRSLSPPNKQLLRKLTVKWETEYLDTKCPLPFFMKKDKAIERTGHSMVSEHHHP